MTNTTDLSPTLVLMAGLPGAGKTTLADALGQATGWPVLHKDEIKEWFLLQGLQDSEASWQAYEESFKHIFNTLVEQRISIILDTSAQYPFVVEHSMRLARLAGSRLKVVLCYASDDVRVRRLGGRPNRTGPLPMYSPPLYNIRGPNERVRFEHLPRNTLHLNTERSLQACMELILRYLDIAEL